MIQCHSKYFNNCPQWKHTGASVPVSLLMTEGNHTGDKWKGLLRVQSSARRLLSTLLLNWNQSNLASNLLSRSHILSNINQTSTQDIDKEGGEGRGLLIIFFFFSVNDRQEKCRTVPCPFWSATSSFFPHNACIWCVYLMKPGGWRSGQLTACSFCFGLRAEGFRAVGQTELLMRQCGSQTGPPFLPDSHGTDDEYRWGSIKHSSHVSNVEEEGRLIDR